MLGSSLTQLTVGGAKEKTRVFAGGTVIAEQYNPLSSVSWLVADPVTGSYSTILKDGSSYDTDRKEYEPLGQEVIPVEPEYETYPLFPARSADNPEWLCGAAGMDEKSFYERTIPCQMAEIEADVESDRLHPDQVVYTFTLFGDQHEFGRSSINSKSSKSLQYAKRSTAKVQPSDEGMIKLPGEQVTVDKPENDPIDMTTSPGLMAEFSGNFDPPRIAERITDEEKNNLKKGLEDTFVGDCATFAKEVLKIAADKFPGETRQRIVSATGVKLSETSYFSTDLLKMFDDIANSIDGGIYDYTESGEALGEAVGHRRNNSARINLHLRKISEREKMYPHGSWAKGASWAETIIHELMHHAAGSGTFSDEQLSRAVGIHLNLAVPEFTGTDDEKIGKYSRWWNNILSEKCK